LGGEGTLWSELVTPYNIFTKVWPRLGAISNIFWAPSFNNTIPWGDYVENLAAFRQHLKENGIESSKISCRY